MKVIPRADVSRCQVVRSHDVYSLRVHRSHEGRLIAAVSKGSPEVIGREWFPWQRFDETVNLARKAVDESRRDV